MATQTELREAIDDLWRCIGQHEVADLQPETIELASVIHMRLWHSNPCAEIGPAELAYRTPPGFIDGTARLEELMQRSGFADAVEDVRRT